MGLTLQLGQDPVPGAVLGPQVEAVPNRLPRRETGRDVPPRRPGAEPPAEQIASNTGRCSIHRQPRCGVRSGSSGSICAHISSVNTRVRLMIARVPSPDATIRQTRPSTTAALSVILFGVSPRVWLLMS